MTRSQTKWDRRDKKRNKERYGMKIRGRSILIIPEILRKRAEEVKHDAVAERS